jgi:hypothetical protein
MRIGKTKICEICGKVIQPGGMGGHLRLKHGIKVKTVVKQVREVSREVFGDVRDVREVSGQVRDVSDVREQRPSDYVKRRSEVVEKRIEPVIVTPVDLRDFERIVSCWTKEAGMIPSWGTDKCTLFISGTMKDSVDIYRRKDCPMEKRHWGGLWVCECSLPITHENYRSECKYYSR